MIKTQMFIAAALLAGVAVGYFAKTDSASAAKPSEPRKSAPAAIADEGDKSVVRVLRARVAELERLIAEKDGKSEIAISNVVAEAVRNRPPEPPRGNWRERMEEMRKNDPARYTQMTNSFAQWRRSRAEQAQSKIDFLSSIDTSRMSVGAQKTHAALQDLIARREEMESDLQRQDLSDEERDQLMHELWSTREEFQRLNAAERKNLIRETAHSLGYEGDDAREIAATIQEIIKATDGGWGGGPHGRHRGSPHGGARRRGDSGGR